ncbi:MAG: 16S rRNA (guanine(527)-N(7))-methyltransferase RsmG [Rhodospirillaceae bacterium]|nr:16S rRNA (guanine(527)-N(7))-methyltransferase RsmG [Rhodospirillaceae bacterium]
MVAEASDPLTADQMMAEIVVSRETIQKFELYLNLLKKWNGAINLVSKRSLLDPWRRHILDCAQLSPLIPRTTKHLIDLGSGAGLPGLILAILRPEIGCELIESDQRKAAFLREAARVVNCEITVHAQRIEDVIDKVQHAEVITARALSAIEPLLNIIKPVLNEKKLCIFPKAEGIDKEIEALPSDWKVTTRILQSLSDRRGKILVLEAANYELSD